MRKRSFFRWITSTDNQETDEKRDSCKGCSRWMSGIPGDEVNKEEELTNEG